MKSYITKALVMFCILLLILFNFRQQNTKFKEEIFKENENFKKNETDIFLFMKTTPKKKESITCYRSEAPTLPDISHEKIVANTGIFFLETSCKSFNNNNTIQINALQACAVESAARMNPNRIIRLLYASTGKYNFCKKIESNRFLQTLNSYSNVRINHVNIPNFLKNTPLENLYKNGLLENSKYPVAHASDVLRMLLLWKFGGIYLDLNMVVVKSLETIGLNFAGFESSYVIANGVLSFNSSGAGHEIALKCLLHLQRHFNGTQFGANGAIVITKILQELCGTNNEQNLSLCKSFDVFTSDVFYPIQRPHWKQYFKENTDERIEILLADSYGAHLWSHLGGNRRIRLDSNVVYVKIARKFCPRIYKQCELYF